MAARVTAADMVEALAIAAIADMNCSPDGCPAILVSSTRIDLRGDTVFQHLQAEATH